MTFQAEERGNACRYSRHGDIVSITAFYQFGLEYNQKKHCIDHRVPPDVGWGVHLLPFHIWRTSSERCQVFLPLLPVYNRDPLLNLEFFSNMDIPT